jgi:hypothetical protein
VYSHRTNPIYLHVTQGRQGSQGHYSGMVTLGDATQTGLLLFVSSLT